MSGKEAFVVLTNILKDPGVVCCHSISSNLNDVLSDLQVQVTWGTISVPPGREGYHLFELYLGSRMVATSSNLITRSKRFLDSPRIQSKFIMKFTSGGFTSSSTCL